MIGLIFQIFYCWRCNHRISEGELIMTDPEWICTNCGQRGDIKHPVETFDEAVAKNRLMTQPK